MLTKRILVMRMVLFTVGPVLLMPRLAGAVDGGLTDIQKQLVSLYPAGKATADGTDLVAAGAVLVLQKDNLLMCKVEHALPTTNYYKNGAITQGGLGGLFKAMNALNRASAAGADGAPPPSETREFVAGEKFFVTRIFTGSEGVTFVLMSDPIKDQRYKATLKFPFAKGAAPTPDDVAAMVAEVIKVDSTEDSQPSAGPAAPAAPTRTIALGQTRDEVVAMFGVPTKVVQLGAKEIDFFQDMKVTFVKNKVANVE